MYPSPRDSHLAPRPPVDALAVEIGRLCPDMWISSGFYGRAFNFYSTGGRGTTLEPWEPVSITVSNFAQDLMGNQ